MHEWSCAEDESAIGVAGVKVLVAEIQQSGRIPPAQIKSESETAGSKWRWWLTRSFLEEVGRH